ncbi:MAG TPA: hypothetical protein VHD83_21155, partial [Puia sp.]|nr:hypothetical protein [Puia sp.]
NLLLLIAIFGHVNAQDTSNLEKQANTLNQLIKAGTKERYDQIDTDRVHRRLLSPDAYDHYFDNYFTLLAYNQETFPQGNSAALKVSDNQTKLNLTLSKKSGNSIFSIGTSLNISDNTGTLFSGNKPTAGTQFSFTYSYLFGHGTALRYDAAVRDSLLSKRSQFWDSVNTYYSVENPARASVVSAQLVKVTGDIAYIQNLIAHAGNDRTALLSYKEQLLAALAKKDSLQKILSTMDYSPKTDNARAKDILESADEAILKKELAADGVTVFHLSWVTFNGAYQRWDYDTYDSTLALSKRVGDRPFDGYALTAAYNFYWQRTASWIKFRKSKGFNSAYWNFSYSAANGNSYDKIKETTLTTTKVRTENDTLYQFSSDQKLRDISGIPFTKLWVHKLGTQFSGMLGQKQFFGINATAGGEFAHTRRPIFNTHIGLLFHFLDSSDEKSYVNFELFLAFNDMTDTQEKGKSVWQRKTVGITAAVPFQKVFFR